jgi:hypothetical protein
MTFEDLQEHWKHQDAKLETILHLNIAQLGATQFASMSAALDRVRRSIWIELLLNAAAVLMLGPFIADNIGDLRYAAPAVALHICAIVLVATSISQLVALQRIDYACPVLDVQRRLTRLKISRVRTTKWILLLAPAFWTPLLIVTLKGLMGVDGYAAFDAGWIAVNGFGSLAFIPLMLWAAHRFGDRLSRSPLLRELANDLAGRSLNEASAFADKLAGFERQNCDGGSA